MNNVQYHSSEIHEAVDTTVDAHAIPVDMTDDADDTPKFIPAPGAAIVEIEVQLNGVDHKIQGYEGQTLVSAMEDAGIEPPSSCRNGVCGSCMCQMEEGSVEMEYNEVLDKHDLERGWILGCQATPTSKRLRVVYPS